MTLNNSFINDVTMFFIGAINGVILHSIIQWFVEMYEITSIPTLILLGVFQLLFIAFSVKLFSTILNIQGFFILGIISSQDLLIFKVFPKNIKIK